ncbi:tetratricopeptide repeat protein [Flavobacterium sp. RHBU_24]|uniref:tetratricopeptide repeat protein n=1 Tax=Flavobacterium sp. RHBU_24 TaxID=3391185 RepID=UPI003984C010
MNNTIMKYVLSLILVLFSTLAFAQNTYDFAKAEKNARKLVSIQPDSALAIIKKTLAQQSVHDSVYGAMYNIYGIYYGMRGNNDSLIYYQKKSISYLEEYPELKAGSLKNLSIGYRNKGDFESALTHINLALEINRRIKNNVGIAVDYGEIASVYNTMSNYEKSIGYLLKGIEILKKEKKQEKLPALEQKLANTYLAQRNFKFAIDLYTECLKDFKRQGQMKNYYLTLVNLAEAKIHVDDYNGAKNSLAEAIKGLEEFGDKSMIGICYAKLGNAEQNLKHHPQALAAYKKGIDILLEAKSNRTLRIASEYLDLLNQDKNYSQSLDMVARIDGSGLFGISPDEDRMLYKKSVGDAYSGAHNSEAAIKAYQETIRLKDSIAATERQMAIREVQAKFQTELQREKNVSLEATNKVLEKDLKTERTLALLYVIGALSIIITVLLALRSFRLKNRLQNEELKTLAAEKNMIQQQHQHEQELINAQRETIDEKQRELASTALRMASFQDGVTQIIEKCSSGEINKIADMKKELQLLAKQEDYWKQFETRFNNVHPEFGTSLQMRFSKLTKNDVEFCSLLKLNLSNKEIASLLQISHESAITKKYRIKKKMEINDDEEFERLLMEM